MLKQNALALILLAIAAGSARADVVTSTGPLDPYTGQIEFQPATYMGNAPLTSLAFNVQIDFSEAVQGYGSQFILHTEGDVLGTVVYSSNQAVTASLTQNGTYSYSTDVNFSYQSPVILNPPDVFIDAYLELPGGTSPQSPLYQLSGTVALQTLYNVPLPEPTSIVLLASLLGVVVLSRHVPVIEKR